MNSIATFINGELVEYQHEDLDTRYLFDTDLSEWAKIVLVIQMHGAYQITFEPKLEEGEHHQLYIFKGYPPKYWLEKL